MPSTHTHTHTIFRKLLVYLHHPSLQHWNAYFLKMVNRKLLDFLFFVQVFLIVLTNSIA